MLNKLPNDLKIYIYKFLPWEDITNIEDDVIDNGLNNNDNNLIMLIKSYNNSNQKYEKILYNRILCNVRYKLCFYCYDHLDINYLLNICSYCKYKINDTYLYPLVCKKCVPLKYEREWLYKKCKLCNNFCGYLGILPYS